MCNKNKVIFVGGLTGAHSCTYNWFLIKILGDIGGTLGLCLGASVLTFCELIDFIVIQLFYGCCVRKKKSNTHIRKDQAGSLSVEHVYSRYDSSTIIHQII